MRSDALWGKECIWSGYLGVEKGTGMGVHTPNGRKVWVFLWCALLLTSFWPYQLPTIKFHVPANGPFRRVRLFGHGTLTKTAIYVPCWVSSVRMKETCNFLDVYITRCGCFKTAMQLHKWGVHTMNSLFDILDRRLAASGDLWGRLKVSYFFLS